MIIAPIVQNTTGLPTLTTPPLSSTGSPLSLTSKLTTTCWVCFWEALGGHVQLEVAYVSEPYLIKIPSVTSSPKSLVTSTVSHEVNNPTVSTAETASIALVLTSTAVVTSNPAPTAPMVVASGVSITQGAPPVVVDPTTTSVPGHTPTIVSGETVVLSSSILFVSTNTEVLPTFTRSSPIFTTPPVVGGLTFSVPSLTSQATTGSPLVVGGATVSYIPSASDFVVGTQTVLPGSAVTISGIPISFDSSDLVVGATTGPVSLETIAISTASASSSNGLGGVILSAFNGVAMSASTTAAGIDIKPFLSSASRLQHNVVMVLGIILLGFTVAFWTTI